MNNSIQHFNENEIAKINKILEDYAENPKNIAEMVQGVMGVLFEFGRNIIAEEWERYDNIIKQSPERKEMGWQVKSIKEATLVTSIGPVQYRKTLYHNKNTGAYLCLLDSAMGVEKHARMTEDAEAKILEEAVQSSYRKGGESISMGNTVVSKETVKNKIHRLNFPDIEPKEKKQVKYLYIDADEDHVALQFMDKKRDIEKATNNTAMPKLAYVYEGVNTENSKCSLVNCAYFGGLSDSVEAFWKKVNNYIEKAYDTEYLEKVFINGDGAAWIKSGKKYIDKAYFVLDKFHMHKYIIAATSHLKDSTEDARAEIYRAIHQKKKRKAEEIFEQILSVTESESKKNSVENAKKYILGNWAGIMEQMSDKDARKQCSAEGHISHIYADRMSSRPLGWSTTGVDKMAQLRVYYYNKGSMLELVRFQKEATQMAAGAEEWVCSGAEIFKSERANRRKSEGCDNIKICSVPVSIKKVLSLREYVWGL